MSDPKKESTPKDDKVDAELSNLLEVSHVVPLLHNHPLLPGALQDFNKDSSKEANPDPAKDELPDEASVEWTEDFIKQAASQFEQNLATFLGSSSDGTQLTNEQLQQKFQQMAEAAQQVIENPNITENSNDFASTISQTIQGLNAGAEGLQNPFSEQDMMNLFGRQGDQNAFLPFMQGMMQSLLSKDVLYPSLKDILDKFPEWLRTNKDSLSREDAERFENQKKLMEEVCAELEKEKETHSEEQKKERFEKVLGLMQKVGFELRLWLVIWWFSCRIMDSHRLI